MIKSMLNYFDKGVEVYEKLKTLGLVNKIRYTSTKHYQKEIGELLKKNIDKTLEEKEIVRLGICCSRLKSYSTDYMKDAVRVSELIAWAKKNHKWLVLNSVALRLINLVYEVDKK